MEKKTRLSLFPLFFLSLTLTLTPSTTTCPVLSSTLDTTPTLPLSDPAITWTVSPVLTCTVWKTGLPLAVSGVDSHFLPGPCCWLVVVEGVFVFFCLFRGVF